MASRVVKPSPEPPIMWIDTNEDGRWHFSAEFRRFGFNPEVKRLVEGDFKFVAMGRVWPVERKSIPNDLESSFTDGRLAGQFGAMLEKKMHPILLLEGPMQLVTQSHMTPIRNVLFELQALGGLIDMCETGAVVERLVTLHHFLNKQDHSFFRKPTLPMPSKFDYKNDRRIDGGVTTFQKVRVLLCFRGIGEVAAVEALKRFTLAEIIANPGLIMVAYPSVSRTAIARMYEHLGLEVPEAVIRRPVKRSTVAAGVVERGDLLVIDRKIS